MDVAAREACRHSPHPYTFCACRDRASPLLDGKGGLYCGNCDVAVRDDSPRPTETGVRSYAIDPAQAERLWTLSAELTGLDAVAKAA